MSKMENAEMTMQPIRATKLVTFTMELPADLEALLLKQGPIDWGHTGAKSDEQHLADFADTLRLTREHFGTEGDTDLHGLYLQGQEVVIAHTGTSPNSSGHARIIAGLWNALHAQTIATSPTLKQLAGE